MQRIYYNAKIYCGAGQFASALFVREDRVAAVGRPEDFAAVAARRIDLGGKFVLPGLNDSHLHLLDTGRELSAVNLYGAATPGELAVRCKAYLARQNIPAGQTLLGNGWNQDKFAPGERRLPTKADLDGAAPQNPLVLYRVCGHIAVCNAAALRAAGITPNTPCPAGGGLDFAAGLLQDNALALLDGILPGDSVESCTTAYLAATARAAARGITSAQSCDVDGENGAAVLGALQGLDAAGLLPLRISLQCALPDVPSLERFLATAPPQGKRWQIGALKLFSDGALGARNAWLGSDYADDPGNRGLCCLPFAQALAMTRAANAHGLQTVAHAIGDAAIAQMLAVYKAADASGRNPCRNGIIHCQVMREAQWDDFKQSNILALVQPIFLDYDHTIAAARCGQALADSSYSFGTALQKGVPVSYGTDAPVEDLNPFPNLYCAITRKALDGTPPGGWHPAQRVSRAQALACYTTAAAHAQFAEGEKGLLAPGYLADFIVIDRDYFTVPEEELPHIQVLQTIVGGRQVYAGPV